MPVKKYDRKNKRFYIIIPKLIHIGPIKKNNRTDNLKELKYNEKEQINDFVEKVKYFGTEFGAKKILSFCSKDIFKISDDFSKNEKKVDKVNQNKIKFNKKESSIDIIKKQLGIT